MLKIPKNGLGHSESGFEIYLGFGIWDFLIVRVKDYVGKRIGTRL